MLLDDLIGRHIAISGKFDRSIISPLLKYARPGDQCVDVGANIGYVSCLLLKHIPDSKVLAIEPQPMIADIAEKNLAHFPRDRWELLRAGLSEHDGAGFLRINTHNRGNSSLVNEASNETVNVPLLAASRILGSLDRIDLIKIDVEGHEETVFRSAETVLTEKQPRAILFEDQTGKAAPNGAIGSILARAGYRVFGIRKSLFNTALVGATEENARKFNDFLALPTNRKHD